MRGGLRRPPLCGESLCGVAVFSALASAYFLAFGLRLFYWQLASACFIVLLRDGRTGGRADGRTGGRAEWAVLFLHHPSLRTFHQNTMLLVITKDGQDSNIQTSKANYNRHVP